MKPIITLLFCLFTYTGFCQGNKYEMSGEVDIPQKGWSKVLMMRNGNTLLFHFELRKGIVVKVFDKTHKEIANQKHICKILDINALDHAEIKGLYDINGEAVLFVEQDYRNKRTLIRLRINADNGGLIEEKAEIESPSMSDNISFRILKDKNTDDYYVLCFRDIHWHPEAKTELIAYNCKHEQIQHTPIDIDGKGFTDVDLLGCQLESNGSICMTVYLASPDVTSVHIADAFNHPTTYNKYVDICYMPKGFTSFFQKKVKLVNEVFPTYAISSYNSFAKSINVLIMSSRPEYKQDGILAEHFVARSPLLVILDENDLSCKYEWLGNDSINTYLKQHTDTTNSYSGIALNMFTNRNGLTTVLYEGYQNYNEEMGGRIWPYTNLKGIGITKLDDNGKELAGVMMQKEQFVRNQSTPRKLANRHITKKLFGDLPLQDYMNQFISTNSYVDDKSLHIVYNDVPQNFARRIGQPCDSVYEYEYTDACYLTRDKNKEIVKKHLFDAPVGDESRSSFLEGADFDDKTNTYATLVSYRKGKDITLYMAWCQLE